MAALTYERAKELLATLPTVSVRFWRDDTGAQHAGRGTLVRLEGKNKALIKTGKGREETVNLSRLAEWKGGNAFAQELKSKMEVKEPSAVRILAGTDIPDPFRPGKERYLILNRNKQSVYIRQGKQHSWLANPSMIHVATTFRSHQEANKAINAGIQASVEGDTLEIHPKGVAIKYISEWWQRQEEPQNGAVPPAEVIPTEVAQEESVAVAAPASEEADIFAEPPPPVLEIVKVPPVLEPAPIPAEPDLSASDLRSAAPGANAVLSLDLDQIEKEDSTPLITAINNRKRAAADVKDAKKILAEAIQRLQETEAAYQVALKSLSLPVTTTVPTPETPNISTPVKTNTAGKTSNAGKKRSATADAVLGYVNRMKRLESTSALLDGLIAQKISADALNQRLALKQCVLSLRKKGSLIMHPDGSITPKVVH